MQKVIDEKKCTGCSACYNLCSQGAIDMIEDTEGFKYPKINKTKCVNCGLCRKKCPVLKAKKEETIIKTYAAYNKELTTRLASSSGGIFYLLANAILKNKGIVVGASFEKGRLKHKIIYRKEDINSLMGSKYFQSELKDIFKKIKKHLDDNKEVLFIGTPCQIAGLDAYLSHDYEKLYKVDLICHGVPSFKVFEKYVNDTLNYEKINKVNFRDKRSGWETYSITINDKTEPMRKNIFMRGFLYDLYLRKSCYNCTFKLKNKTSDLTLGDFWGVKKYHPDLYDNKGTSAIIINTKKGEKLFSLIKDDIMMKECNITDIVSNNPSLVNCANYNPKRESFFAELDSVNFKDLIGKYAKRKSIIERAFLLIKSKIKK